MSQMFLLYSKMLNKYVQFTNIDNTGCLVWYWDEAEVTEDFCLRYPLVKRIETIQAGKQVTAPIDEWAEFGSISEAISEHRDKADFMWVPVKPFTLKHGVRPLMDQAKALGEFL